MLIANTADDSGGGVMADNIANVEFHNCAIVGNVSERNAGGVYKPSGAGGGDFGVAFVDSEDRQADVRDALGQAGFALPELSFEPDGLRLEG